MNTRLQKRTSVYVLLLLFSLVSVAEAVDDSFATKFLGSPLLILVALIIIDAIALAYHKIRK